MTSKGTVDEIPTWFWDILVETRPSLLALAKRLEALPRERLIAFASAYETAAEEVCDYWSGPVVGGVEYSEDDTEDLCKWIVAQGPDLWRTAVQLRGAIAPMGELKIASDAGRRNEHPRWSTEVENVAYEGYQAPESVAYAIFAARFGQDLHELLG